MPLGDRRAAGISNRSAVGRASLFFINCCDDIKFFSTNIKTMVKKYT